MGNSSDKIDHLLDEPIRREYCNDCGDLVMTEDEGFSTFYCDCGNEWVEGGQDKQL